MERLVDKLIDLTVLKASAKNAFMTKNITRFANTCLVIEDKVKQIGIRHLNSIPLACLSDIQTTRIIVKGQEIKFNDSGLDLLDRFGGVIIHEGLYIEC